MNRIILLFFATFSLFTLAGKLDQAAFRVCITESCIAVDAPRAVESRKDQSMTFYSSTVSFYDRKTQKLLKRTRGNEVTWKPDSAQLWITSASGELNIYNFRYGN